MIEFSSLTETVLAVLHIYNMCLSYKLQQDKVTDRRSLKYKKKNSILKYKRSLSLTAVLITSFLLIFPKQYLYMYMTKT